MKKYFRVIILLLVIIGGIGIISLLTKEEELKSIKNEKELNSFYEKNYREENEESKLLKILTLPFSILIDDDTRYYESSGDVLDYTEIKDYTVNSNDAVQDENSVKDKDYSKTNIQVEGVDEADIIKTDGDYIYSISGNDVIISNVKNPSNVVVVSRISGDNNYIPVDIILNKDKLVIISESNNGYYERNTIVKIYNISSKEKPKLEKTVELYEPYYSTRCIDNKLYVFSSGVLRKKNNKILRDYKEDSKSLKINYNNIKYLSKTSNNIQTLILEVDLSELSKNANISSYLLDITNSYVSRDNIYLIDQDYEYDKEEVRIRDLFGLWGVIGVFNKEYEDNSNNDDYSTIYKFKIDSKKGVLFKNKNKVKGKTINQYSFDEKDGNLRVALESRDGTRVVVFDKNLKVLGESNRVAEGEIMYSSRFMGDKAYLVTYQNTDPLFVVDLSNPKKPTVQGELHIPGYSTYLHPYDENHLIGIGMDTEERVTRDSDGRVISSGAVIRGMKMSLFDVSDINNPKEISKITIGDSRTVSAILTNPKALLFSKEKELLAIPVNHYDADFYVEESSEVDDDINSFISTSKNYKSEGYFVYHIDLDKGFELKGVIDHEKENSNDNYYYYYRTKLLRGLYIDNNLFTVSEDYIKVNKLDTLEEISKLKIKNNGVDNNE